MNRSFPTAPIGLRHDLPRWRQLVSPAWTAALVAGAPVPAPPQGQWRLFEVGCGGQALYEAGHIPGAAYLDTAQFEGGPWWNKIDDSSLLQVLLDCGIDCDLTVVLAGRNILAAARLAHLLLYAGVRDVRLLDGGLPAWIAAGLPLAQGRAPAPLPVAAFGAPFPGQPQLLCDTPALRQLLGSGDAVLVSTRTWKEFIGHTSGYSYIAARGEIAGARWGRAGADADVHSMSEFHDAQGRMRAAAEIAAMWQAAGVDGQAEGATVFYCGTGWRASLAFFYAWLMGWERIAVYDGGWYEWSGDPDNPVQGGAAD